MLPPSSDAAPTPPAPGRPARPGPAAPLESTREPAALVIAHPGHELRIHGWLGRARASVFVLTDGGGHAGRSRLESTTRILERLGARPAAPYGRYPDTTIYGAILEHRVALFTGWVEELASAFVRDGIVTVAGDSVEGYNPSHDACRLMINAAVALASRRSGRPIANYDFPLMGRPDHQVAGAASFDRLELTDEEFALKVESARGYAELDAEVDAALKTVGTDPFRVEYLRRLPEGEWSPEVDDPPFYERHGERRVKEGLYSTVLRYREHMKPLADALERYVGERASCAA